MNGFNLSRSQSFTRISLALLASSAAFTAGCANMITTAASTNALDAPATVTGKVHGGNQPVSGATVKIWYVGEGTALASVGATTTSAADGAGSFSFIKAATNGLPPNGNTFSCPSDSTLVYVVATGGNPLNNGVNTVNNTAAVFLAPYGPCKNITSASFVDMTEVSTVATMAALQQYFNPLASSTSTAAAESFSTDGSGLAKTAVTNAFSTIANLADVVSGSAVVSKVIPAGSITAGYGYAGISVTAIPESTKLNLIANIIASCVNNATSSAPNCATLFSNAAPPDPATTSRPYGTVFPAATDVLQAAYYMLTNPTDGGSSKLTNLYNLSAAAGAPFQPALSPAPSDWTLAVSYSSVSSCGSNSGHFISNAQDLAVDIYGGIWMANSEPGKGNLTQVAPNGVPVTCIAIGSGANSGVTIDNKTGTLGNIWLADSASSNVYRYTPGQSTSFQFPTTVPPAAIAADGTGNIYFTSGAASGTLYEMPGAVASATAVTPLAITTAIGTAPARIMLDSTSAVWTTSGSSFITRSASATPNTGGGFTSLQLTTPTPTYGISTTAIPSGSTKNFVYVGAYAPSNTLSLFQGIGASYSSVAGWPVTTALASPAAVASDGAQNVWTVNNGSSTGVVEVGNQLQPLSGFGGFKKSNLYLASGRSLVIDQSGNVWISLDNTNSITEIVGAAVPVAQPYSDALKNNRFQHIP